MIKNKQSKENMIKAVARKVGLWWIMNKTPEAARFEVAIDWTTGLGSDPGAKVAVEACGRWLCRAQDNSRSFDGGVARHYGLLDGWAASYPETTGYIVPTMIRLSREFDDPDYLDRAERMLDWLTEIQLQSGGFQGGTIDKASMVPATFNTGQILLGLAEGFRIFGHGRYEESMHRAAGFLRDSQDRDGCWRSHPSPFAETGEKAYETHVSWGLLEAERLASGFGYADAGLRQVEWALTKQHRNGWVEDCSLDDPSAPLTHTLGYFLRGVLEAYRYSERASFLEAAKRTADALVKAQRRDGALPGMLRKDWSPAAKWSCLTGNSQISECLLLLFGFTNDDGYLAASRKLNSFVRRTLRTEGKGDAVGGVKGSFPVDGEYGRFQYLNWAAKFTVDANIAELDSEKFYKENI